jgi:hypothetical protein
MEKIASKYNQADSEKRLTEIYQEFINDRIKLLEGALIPPTEPNTQPAQ